MSELMREALIRAEQKLMAYVGVCAGDKELTDAVLPMVRKALAQPEQRGEVVALKGVGRITGDGWKDTTQVGQVVFVWNAELPEPYASGQFPRIGNPIWSASRDQYDFEPASPEELRQFVEARIKSAAPPAPSVPDGWKLAAYRPAFETCESQCKCGVCGTTFGAAPEVPHG